MTKLPANDRRPGLSPPRFGLSTLLGLVAVLCAIFAVVGTAGPYAAFALILLVLAIFAHVAGNAIGTYLRDNGDRPLHEDGTPIKPSQRLDRDLSEDDYAPATRLGRRYSLGWTVLITTAVGILLGATGGGLLLTLANWSRITLPSIMFAVFFSGALGGFAGFLTSSFVHVLIGAHIEALRQAKRR